MPIPLTICMLQRLLLKLNKLHSQMTAAEVAYMHSQMTAAEVDCCCIVKWLLQRLTAAAADCRG